MEIVIVTGVLVLAGLVLLALRIRAPRGSVRTARSARQWSGSAGTRAGRPAAAAAASTGAVAFTPAGGGGAVAVQDQPRTREADLDEWDDDLGWGDEVDEPAPVARPTAHRAAAPVVRAAPITPAAPVGDPAT